MMEARADMVLFNGVDFVQYVEANKDKKGLPKSKEPGRPKTHWDFVIEEMSWLAKVSKAVRRLDREGSVWRFVLRRALWRMYDV